LDVLVSRQSANGRANRPGEGAIVANREYAHRTAEVARFTHLIVETPIIREEPDFRVDSEQEQEQEKE
jgi:hypothetical protein